MTRKVLVLSAGLSTPSSTRLLADQLAAATDAAVTARGEAVAFETVELRELANDLVVALTGNGLATPALARVRDQVSSADALIAVTPVFSGSYSGLFKMFFDVLGTDALNGLPVLIAATAGTPRHSLMLDHAMRPLFTYLRAVVVPTGVFAATEDFGDDSGLEQRVSRAAAELAGLVVGSNASVAGFTPGLPARQSGNRLDGAVTPFAQLLEGHQG